MSVETVLQIALYLVSAGAVYGGIRADLRAMHERIEMAQRAAQSAHRRIDTIVDRRAGA